MSCTVTTEVQVDTLLLLSVTVRVTVFAPTFAQVKLFGDNVIDFMPHSSVEPLLTWAVVMLALPVASNCIVKF